jgi:hypothetical protein
MMNKAFKSLWLPLFLIFIKEVNGFYNFYSDPSEFKFIV